MFKDFEIKPRFGSWLCHSLASFKLLNFLEPPLSPCKMEERIPALHSVVKVEQYNVSKALNTI